MPCTRVHAVTLYGPGSGAVGGGIRGFSAAGQEYSAPEVASEYLMGVMHVEWHIDYHVTGVL